MQKDVPQTRIEVLGGLQPSILPPLLVSVEELNMEPLNPTQPVLNLRLGELEEDSLTPDLVRWNPRRIATGDLHSLGFGELGGALVVTWGLDPGEADECPDLTQPFRQDDLLEVLGETAGRTHLTQSKVPGPLGVSRINEDQPFRGLQVVHIIASCRPAFSLLLLDRRPEFGVGHPGEVPQQVATTHLGDVRFPLQVVEVAPVVGDKLLEQV